jgi:hypothetical protein|uniref:Uncharacterized protein n=2 Tax=Picea TaxID=3328 RepID=A0A101M3G9_PICGL|nr:hypothetical protein ABT39_MTgene214 [Picea glauca]QHR90091.1 hypothetical protein Q903MT_gene4114 [Picea sitchensis]
MPESNRQSFRRLLNKMTDTQRSNAGSLVRQRHGATGMHAGYLFGEVKNPSALCYRTSPI